MIMITDNMIIFGRKGFEIKMIFDEIEKIEGGYMMGKTIHHIDYIIREGKIEINNKTLTAIMQNKYTISIAVLKLEKVWRDFMEYVARKFKEG